MHSLVKLMLRGSLAALVATAVVTGCGGDDDDATNNPPGDGGDGSGGNATAGSNSTSGSAGETQTGAGAPAAGGTATGEAGAGPGMGGAAPAEGGAAQGGDGSIFGGAPNAGGASGLTAAIAKFCNTSADDVTLRLEIGQAAEKVTFTAAPGECAPADGEACSEIPTGQAVLVALYDDANDQLPLHVNPQKLADGEAWIFSVEEKGMNTTWVGNTLKAGVACEDVTFADL